MKIRNGFVSNSSSSSFIVAVARVVDETKLRNWLKALKIDKYDYDIVDLKDIGTDKNDSVRRGKDGVIVESFTTNVRLKINETKENDKIFFVNIINNEGDSQFSVYDEDGEYSDLNYDIDLDFFNEEQIKLYDGLNENNGISNIEKTYGAGRNG